MTKPTSFKFLAVFLCCLFPAVVKAQPVDGFVALKAEFKKLSASDPDVSQLESWDLLAAKVGSYIEHNPAEPKIPDAYFMLGRLSETTYRKRQFLPALSRAVDAYQSLADKFPRHKLADDALVALGEIQQNELHDLKAAKRSYQAVLRLRASGDTPQIASAHLAEIQQLEVSQNNTGNFTLGDLASGKFHLFQRKPKPGDSKQLISEKPLTKRPLIVIDPGHGGEDEGAIGVQRVEEKEVTLNIALMLDEMLRDRLRARTVLTRVRDVVVALPDRTKLANDERADLFVSIHTNASPSKTARGIETYYLDNTNDKSSLKLAERENASLSFGGKGGDLGFIVSDLIQNVKLEDSIALAHRMQSALTKTILKRYPDSRDLGVKKAPFFVLVGAHMPCVLVEVSFIDNPVEGARLITRDYQKLVAHALFHGIKQYYLRTQ